MARTDGAFVLVCMMLVDVGAKLVVVSGKRVGVGAADAP